MPNATPRAPGAAKAPARAPALAPRRVPKRELPALARVVWDRLAEAHPDAHCELAYRDAYELLCATILSAQCTDKRVNLVTPALFAAYPDARALAAARVEDVEAIVKTTGFFRSKARNLVAMARALADGHGGAVPADMDALVVLPGVGRKTANVVLGNAFDVNVGVTVDTHVGRVARRLGLTRAEDPLAVERDLMPLFPRERWALLSHRLIFHGRRVCDARRPRCAACVLNDVCASAFRAGGDAAPAGGTPAGETAAARG